MKRRFLSSCVSFINRYYNYSGKDLKKLEYGLEGLYLTLTKTIVIFICAIILGIFKEVLIILVLFNLIRYTGFGFHAEKSYQCLICSLINFILLPLFFLNIHLPQEISLFICMICIFNYLLFAPADTVKRPLPNKKKRIIRRVLTVIIGILYTLVMLIFDNDYISGLILTSLIIEVIVINPITYKIFKQPYNNYKNCVQA